MKEAQRIWNGAPARLLARKEGYVMVRRKGAMPVVLPEREWDALPEAEPLVDGGIEIRPTSK